MKTTKKVLSAFLAVSVVLISLLVPMVSAADECTIETSGNSVRIIPANKSFAAGTAREFTFTVPAAGDYAVFVAQTAAKNDYTVTFTPAGGDAVTYRTGKDGGLDGMKYSYARIGAAEGTSRSAALPAGECTISITPVAAATVNYIDIRSTSFTIDGSKQAIYPSDYTTYSNVGYYGHINGEMQSGEAKIAGYDYFSDYNSSTLTSKFTTDRKIHVNGGVSVTYNINVAKAGNYSIMVSKAFYAYGTSQQGKPDATGTVTVSVNDGQSAAATGTIKGGANGGTTDRSETAWLMFNAELSEGTNTITYKSAGTGSYIYNITIEEILESSDKVVTVDDNLTRIETDAATKKISGGATRDFEFTVPVTGSYIFATQHPKTYAGNISAAIRNESTLKTTTVYDGTWQDDQNNAYAKIGDCNTPPVTLEAGITYKLSLTPASELTVNYLDVLRTDIPINGKTAIPPNYVTTSNLPLQHLNSDDRIGSVIPLDGHTLVGDYRSDKLAAPSNGILTNLYMNNTGYHATYTLDVQTPGYYKFVVGSGQWEDKDLTGKLFFSVNNVEFGSDDYSGTVENKNDILYSPSIYFYSGKQTLTIANKKGYGCGMYVKYLLAEPADAGTGIVNAESLPATLSANLVSETAGSISANGIALNNGQSASWKIKTSDLTADLKFVGGTAPDGAQVSCRIDGGDEITAAFAEMGTILENMHFTEGEHTVQITAKTNGIVVNGLSLNEHKAPVPVAAGATRTKTDLTNGAVTRGTGSLQAASGTLNALSQYTITFDIADEGYYAVYVTGVLEQSSFHAYFDGVDVTTPWYRSTANKDNVSSARSQQDKRLAVPTKLSSGRHTFMLEITEGYKAELASQLELRRTDGPLYAGVSDGERVIPAYDFVSSNVTTDGWYFLHQYGQGARMEGTAKGYEDFTVRNLVLDSASGNQGWTYIVTAPEDGLYDFGFYHSNAGSGVRVTVDEGPEVMYRPTNSSSTVAKFNAPDPLYLTKGEHTITVRKESVSGTLRFNGLSFTKRNTVAIDEANSKASVSIELDSPVTGKIITAFYKDKELVGLKITDAANTDSLNVSAENLAAVPDSAKVMVWKDLDSVEPLKAALSFNTNSPEWVVK